MLTSKGDDIPIVRYWDCLPIPPHRGFSLADFIDGEMRLEIDIQKPSVGTFPDAILQRKFFITLLYANQLTHMNGPGTDL